MPTLDFYVSASSDDAGQASIPNDVGRNVTLSGSVSITDTILAPGSHGTNDEHTSGMRFLNVTVPNGTTISSATLTLTANSSYNAAPNVIKYYISAQAADDPSTFTTTGGNLNATNRPRTTAYVVTDQTAAPGDNVTVTIDVTDPVQEIINRPGWASGNSLVLLIDTHEDTTTNEWQEFYAYDDTTHQEPKLSITYSSATLTQEGYRWRNDDGSETAATWIAAQDADITTIGLDTNVRLRVLIDATGDPDNNAYRLYYKKSTDGSYVVVPTAASSKVQPVIEAADGTGSSLGTAGSPWSISYPNASTGDLLITLICWDDSTTVASLTPPSGPNGETFTAINATPAASASTEMRLQGWYAVATGSWTAGTRNWTPAASETFCATVVRVPAGEFDATTPIGASSTSVSSGTAETNLNSPAFSAGSTDGGGTLLILYGSDSDAITAPASGGSTIRNQTAGGVGHLVWVRTTAVSDSESIAATTATIAGDSWASMACVVRAPTVTVPVYIAASGNITAGGEATTAQLSAPSGKTTGDFVTGRMWDNENGSDSLDITADDYTELEWSIRAQSPATVGDIYQFRIYNNTTALDTYSVTPQWTIAGSGLNAQADITIGAVTTTATAAVASVAQADITIGAVTTTATAAVASVAQADITIGAVTTTATAAIGDVPLSAQADITIGAITTTATAAVASVAQADITIGAVTTTATAAAAITAVADIIIGAVTTTATAAATNTAQADITIGAVSTTATAVVAVKAQASIILDAITTAAVAVGPSTNYNISVGSGYTDVSPKQLVRTSNNRLYIAASNCDSYPCDNASQTLRMYRANSTGMPSGFTRQDSGGEISGVAQWAIAIDGDDQIHVVYTQRSSTAGNITAFRYIVYDTTTDTWGSPEAIDTGTFSYSSGQGDQSCSLALDSDGKPHACYLKTDGTRRRMYYRNRVSGSWSGAELVDDQSFGANEKVWHPNIVFDIDGRRVFAWLIGSFNDSTDGTIFVKTRETTGTWNSTVNVSGTDQALTSIDQSTSMLVSASGRYHISWINASTTPSQKYIHYAYSDNDGASWTRNDPASGTQATHNPALGPSGDGGIRIWGHGTPDSGNHGENLYFFESDDEGTTWDTWTLAVTGTNYDSSVNTRWSQYFHHAPGTIDIAYWNDNYPNNLYAGTSIVIADRFASANITLGAVTTEATATVAGVAQADITLGAVTTTATAAVAITASADITLGAVTTTATASSVIFVAPAAISFVLATTNPTSIAGSLALTPSPVAVITTSSDPVVLLGSATASPSANTLPLATSGPVVVLGSLAIAAAPGAVTITTTNPSVVYGSMNLGPATVGFAFTTTDPSIEVTGGGTAVSPAAVAVTYTTGAPTILLGSIALGPASSSLVVTTTDPSIIAGSVSVTPAALLLLFATTDPSVETNGIIVAPAAGSLILTTTNPTSIAGSLALTPAHAAIGMQSSDPVVVMGSISLAPSASNLVTGSTGPSVVLGLLVLTPSGSVIGFEVAAGALLFGSTTASPAALLISFTTTNPSVQIRGGGLWLEADPATITFATPATTAILSSLVLAPAAIWITTGTSNPMVVLGSLLVVSLQNVVLLETTNPDFVIGTSIWPDDDCVWIMPDGERLYPRIHIMPRSEDRVYVVPRRRNT